MTAIEAMKVELTKIQKAQTDCINESGFVKSSCRYRYQVLTEQAEHFKRSIEWMEALYNEKEATRS